MIFLHVDDVDGKEVCTVIKNSLITGASLYEEDGSNVLRVAYKKPEFGDVDSEIFVNEKFVLSESCRLDEMMTMLDELSQS